MIRKEIQKKFDEIVDFAEVEKFLDTPVKRYSSGMYVRLAFAVAAHLEPEILIVDEVLAVGDVQFQKKCLGKMEEVGKHGRTVLFVSHNMATIEQLCSACILLGKGQLKFFGDTLETINQYLSPASTINNATNGVLAETNDKNLQILSVETVDKNGNSVASIKCGETLGLKLSIKSSRNINNAAFSVGINRNGSRVAVLHTKVSGHEILINSGLTSVTCNVPFFSLAAGLYSLDIKIISQNDALLWAPQITSLSVEMGDFYSSGFVPEPDWAGVVHLRQNWQAVRN